MVLKNVFDFYMYSYLINSFIKTKKISIEYIKFINFISERVIIETIFLMFFFALNSIKKSLKDQIWENIEYIIIIFQNI